MPSDLSEVLTNKGKHTKEECDKASQVAYLQFETVSEDLLSSLAHSRGNSRLEFRMRKRLNDWNIIGDLHKVPCPTLLISSLNDEMWEPVVRSFFDHVPKCKWGSHTNHNTFTDV
ncbi:hypothetical protein L218DRAFT_588854 [Marasmius fiardii PR-910]|nr:hypothetical protein L218DRAFT_588854 [Marasmius fiardii PR-910]